jgi:methionyl-tRNA formyltransferase
MRIILFSAYHAGSVNELNISTLIKSYPEHEFIYVLLDNRMAYIKNTIKNTAKEFILNLLQKKTDWYSDRKKIDEIVKSKIHYEIPKTLQRILVKEVNSKETENIIRSLAPDIIIQCGAGILKENIFSIPPKGTINLHHGIAPELRGISSAFWSMYYGLHEFIGATVHFIDKTLDTGTVIIQKKTILPKHFDYVEAMVETAIQASPLLVEAVRMIAQDYKITEEQVKSYYFSSVSYQKYSELKMNKFNAVGEIESVKFKYKNKKILISM